MNSPRAKTQTINRPHRLLLELFPGDAKRFLSAMHARSGGSSNRLPLLSVRLFEGSAHAVRVCSSSVVMDSIASGTRAVTRDEMGTTPTRR
jgi:hypothetical protein